MSSSRSANAPTRRAVALDRRAVALGLPLALLGTLAGCSVSPLRGRGRDITGSVAVDPVQTRVAQRVRNGLIEDLGAPREAAANRLSLAVTNRVELFLTDIQNDRETGGTAIVEARYRLLDASGRALAEGSETGRASFDAPLQEFARQRAIRDAENRAAREVAARVRLAIAPVLAGGPAPAVALPGDPAPGGPDPATDAPFPPGPATTVVR